MRGRVHLGLAVLLLAGAAVAQYPPPGLESWGRQTYLLDPGESVQFPVTFQEIPVRRWFLLVEGDGRPAHLNVRRDRGGDLLYDQRDETRHQVEVPWGTGESLSAVLTAGRRGGAFTVSIWGPPPDAYRRAYSHAVNRALEDLAAGDAEAAREHLLAALREDPDDAVATTLLRAVSAGELGSRLASVPVAAPADTVAAAARVQRLRTAAAGLLEREQAFAALDSLGVARRQPAPAASIAQVYADLVRVHLQLGNPVQARESAAAAEALGLPPEQVVRLRRVLEEWPPRGEGDAPR